MRLINYGYVPRTFKEFLVGDILTSELLDTQKYCQSREVMEILSISISSLRGYCERQIFKKHEYFTELYERTEILKYKNRDLKKANGITNQCEDVCGNCSHYVWDLRGDRHKGDCIKRDDRENCIYVMARVPDGLHALTGAKHCDSFVLEFCAEMESRFILIKEE